MGFVLTACSSNDEYQGQVQFLFSADRGRTYGNQTKEYEVGETIYMKIIFGATTNRSRGNSQIRATLTIPNIDAVDARYMDGQIITPVFDPVNNVTTYEFVINVSPEGMEQTSVLQFRPNSVASIQMLFEFDDNVDSSFNRMHTIEFVEVNSSEDDD
jgi:hypothetical protein